MEAGAAELVGVPVRRHALSAALTALRPNQWTKNLLVFAGIVFAVQLDDPVGRDPPPLQVCAHAEARDEARVAQRELEHRSLVEVVVVVVRDQHRVQPGQPVQRDRDRVEAAGPDVLRG